MKTITLFACLAAVTLFGSTGLASSRMMRSGVLPQRARSTLNRPVMRSGAMVRSPRMTARDQIRAGNFRRFNDRREDRFENRFGHFNDRREDRFENRFGNFNDRREDRFENRFEHFNDRREDRFENRFGHFNDRREDRFENRRFFHDRFVFFDPFFFPFYASYYPYPYYPYAYGYFSNSPGYGNGYGASIVVQVQTQLARAGYYHGRIDGAMGPRTRTAIRVFERAHGLRRDGTIS
jgi:Putative peptidoglycan binding domain